MLLQPSGNKYFFYVEFVDMRKGFDSLSGIVTSLMQLNPLSTDVYIFINRRRTQLKLLQWEGDGFALYYKRLERGTYERPGFKSKESFICIEGNELQNIFKGISARSNRQRVRYQHTSAIC
jgi:transposase